VLPRLNYLAILLLTATACRKSPSPTNTDGGKLQGANVAPLASAVSNGQHAPLAGEHVEIPAGAFEAGSLPGTEGRKPQLEQQATTVELGPFQIDRLPYPNDPAQPALTNITRPEALAKCAERGARLCTELEWERACRGPNGDEFSTGPRFESECTTAHNGCASGFDVLSLGVKLREFTASDILAPNGGQSRGASVRGALADESKSLHRCARREFAAETERSSNIGFRCCYGPPNAARVTEPHQLAVFERANVDAQAVTKLLSADPKTKDIAKDFSFFRDPEAAETVISRGPGDRQGLRFTVSPLLWSPVAGTRYLLVVGRSGKETSAVLAYYVIREGAYRLAASFLMENEPGPIAFAYHESIRTRLYFSNCWRCPGETGRILYRDPDMVSLVQP
jgi:hypothetical protein